MTNQPRCRVDFDLIRDHAGIASLCRELLEPSDGDKRFVCPSCGSGNLEVTPNDKSWSCWACKTTDYPRDAVGLVQLSQNLGRMDAARWLSGYLGLTEETAPFKPRGVSRQVARKPHLEPYELSSWAESLAAACNNAHELLMSRECDVSRRAWDYLTGPVRNLTSETIARHKLGLNLDWYEFHEPVGDSDGPFRLPPGITIPWLTGPHGISGANVRQLHVTLKGKYVMAKGSRRHWMFPSLTAWAGPILIVEGEFDAMVANQELGGLLPVATLGGAQCKPGDTFDAPTLCRFKKILVAADSDNAGRECRDMWSEFSRRSRSIDMPPDAKDLSDAVSHGVDLCHWALDTCDSLGIDLRQLPGHLWEQPLGRIRGRVLEDVVQA
jgi:hypothetical protein